jgi:transmembrane sensor
LDYKQETIAVHIASLIAKVQEKEPLSEEEQRELVEWLEKEERHVALYNQLLDRKWLMKRVDGIGDYDTAKAVKQILGRLELTLPVSRSRISMIRRLSVAAVFLFALIGTWVLFTRREAVPVTPAAVFSLKNDIPPGGDKAILTLANGSSIVLDSAANGILSRQGTAQVIKSGSGQLIYKAKPGSGSVVAYNTVTTPRGGQYHIQLADGSNVWMNASSSLRFPAVFPANSRAVEITGEVYFEIAGHPSKPFYVSVNGLRIEVLGTHFNVNAYGDEPLIRTTLLEGSIRVRNGDSAAVLAAGQQAQVLNPGAGTDVKASNDKKITAEGIKVVNDIHSQEEAVAWKNGQFYFVRSGIPAAMRQLARWYDLDVEFEQGIPQGHISGRMHRSSNLSTVLAIFQASGVHFRVEGRKVIVTP